MRLAIYGCFSAAFALLAIMNAYSHYSQFYPAAIYLTRSNACTMVCILLSAFQLKGFVEFGRAVDDACGKGFAKAVSGFFESH